MTLLQLVCVGAVLAGVSVATVVNHSPCEELPQNMCTVEEVRIIPCSDPKLCRLQKGNPASISLNFTPNFSTSKLKTGLFWANGAADVPFPDLYEADGCQFTSCPTGSGNSQEFTYSLQLSKKYPKGRYVFKWKLWNEDDANQICCFKTEVRLRN